MTTRSNQIQGWKSVLFNMALALNCMLLFLLLFEDSLSLPAWLQVVGRMHPMLLHFPLVLIVLYALLVVITPRGKSEDNINNDIGSLVLLIAAFTAVITAIMGLFLSKEEGYDQEALSAHKWGGVSISLFAFFWYWFQSQVKINRSVTIITSVAALFLIVVTGHLGAGITHGEDFLLAPVTSTTPQQTVSLEEAGVYKHMVRPILEQKCISCHNNKKAKGELVMETEELLLKGGKNGKLWDTTAADFGLLLQRIHLPLEQKKHMPPKNKPQLTEEEKEILALWIRKGGDFNLKVADLSPSDTLYQIALKNFATTEIVTYDFPEADPSVVSKLNSVNRVVSPEAMGSPALSVSFFNSNLFNSDQLKDLGQIKKQVVSLNLAQMPLQEGDIKLISEFENLRQLNLSFTGISGNSLTELKKLKHLQALSLSGTKVTASQLEELRAMTNLRTVYIWNTSVAEADVNRLKQKLKAISFETGFKSDTIVLKLSPPVSLNEKRFIADTPVVLRLKHYIQNTVIRYTLDGSEPDSIRAAVYKGDEILNSNTFVRARAYKPGWISSDLLEIDFIKNTYTPDTVIYLAKPDIKYADPENKLLINHELGELNFRLGNWVAFRENRMECLLVFPESVTVRNIGLNGLVDVGAYIMPPQQIEIWGGNDSRNLKLLGQLKPQQPGKAIPGLIKNFECKFKPTSVKYVKLIAHPVGKLPAWHPGKGEKAWIFVDEILVN
ncbi:MAG TPA: DUF2231 domain-containing protein [Chitinophagaceae bacterium]